MEVGDSIFVPVEEASTSEEFHAKANYSRMAASAFGRRHGCKFTTRKEGNGIRIWRFA